MASTMNSSVQVSGVQVSGALVSGAPGARGYPHRGGRNIDRRRLTSTGAALSRVKFWLTASFSAELSRIGNWTPVAIGSGAALYFSANAAPPSWAMVIVLLLSGGAMLGNGSTRLAACAIFLAAVGFLAADLRTAFVGAPIIERELKPRMLTGRLVSVEEAVGSRRLVIEVDEIERMPAADLPDRVRINWRGAAFSVLPGDKISIRAGLSPPPPPVAPGAFDFARQLYFQRIGAVGYAVSAPRIINDDDAKTLSSKMLAAVERIRLALARRIVEEAPGQGGAVVAAIVTGKRGAIDDATKAALRDAGLAHFLAISGMHMGIATGLIFFTVRGALAVVEPIALKFPIKKWAAVAALCSGLGYLILSGGGWSARRAFIMASLFFIAILADRRALSLRNVAIAATVILLMTPEAVLHPGFQMSFAAVTALIAAYEWAAARADFNRSFAWWAKLRRYVIGVGVTDTIAATATAPYSLYHFNRAAVYGLPANVIAMPLMAFWIMPLAIVALFLAPLNLDGWAWRLSAEGVDWILASARAVSSQPGAVVTVAQWPPTALALISFGALWLCLMREKWRLLGLAMIPLAAFMIATAVPPDIFVSRDGKNVGIVMEAEGGRRIFSMLNARKDKFSAGRWKEFVGLDKDHAPTMALSDTGRCDDQGCVARVGGANIAISLTPAGLIDDCARSDLVVATYPLSVAAQRSCHAAVIDLRSVWNSGAHIVWVDEERNFKIKTVNAARGNRPWAEP